MGTEESDGERWMKTEKDWGRQIIEAAERELKFLLSHYCSSGGTDEIVGEAERLYPRREEGRCGAGKEL